MANEERPIIQRPNVEERPIIQRPTVDTARPMIQPPDGAPQQPDPTPTQGNPDTGSHPGRKVDRQAHDSRITHRSSFNGQTIELPYI